MTAPDLTAGMTCSARVCERGAQGGRHSPAATACALVLGRGKIGKRYEGPEDQPSVIDRACCGGDGGDDTYNDVCIVQR
jgi:hypothetical protein